MPVKRSSKKAAGLAQPTLTFQSQRKPSLETKRSTSLIPSTKPSKLRQTASDPSLDDRSDKGDHGVEGKENIGEEKRNRKELDGNGKEWNRVMKEAERAMGGKPIHAGPDTHTKVHHILRVFDMTASYGPCVGMTRLQRWERAKKWGLNPPEEIHEILTTAQGEDDESYRENVLHTWV